MSTKKKSFQIGDLIRVRHAKDLVGIIIGEIDKTMKDTGYRLSYWKIYWIDCEDNKLSGVGLYQKRQLERDVLRN